jgi:hypothetical protein
MTSWLPRLFRTAALAVLAWAARPAAARAELFVVAELPGRAAHGDSYVLPLTDPADIAHARALIDRGPEAGATIAMAFIAPGADAINRDYLAPGAPEWSWHVTGFLGFEDFSAEIYDGWPGYVESDVAGWMANTGGVVGFWNYTVAAEVGPSPAPGPATLTLAGLGALGLLGYGCLHGKARDTGQHGRRKRRS